MNTKIGCEGCTKLEHIESTGSQYIDTGVAPNNINIGLEVKGSFVKYLDRTYDTLIGCRAAIHLHLMVIANLEIDMEIIIMKCHGITIHM